MRISKEPEVRKQEIIDVAMKVFAEKGFDATTMKDIAGAAAVVPGLCYHYFQNKQELFQVALTRYARECSRPFIQIFRQTDLTLEQCLDSLEKIVIAQEEDFRYREFFHKEGNEMFHKQLELHISKEIFPYVEQYLEGLAERKEISCDNSFLMARFLWYGQMAVINEEEIPIQERIAFIREMFRKSVE